MLKEVSDQFEVLKLMHQSIDGMLENLSVAQWLERPNGTFNNIASIIDHVSRVERKFMSAVAGQVQDIDTQAPFKATEWDVAAIQADWKDVLAYSQSVLEGLTADDLDKPGLALRAGEFNRRQLITYAIGHAMHHRGQIPLILKML